MSQLAVDDELADLLGSLLGQGQLLLFTVSKSVSGMKNTGPFRVHPGSQGPTGRTSNVCRVIYLYLFLKGLSIY